MVWNWVRKFAIADLYQPIYANHIHREARERESEKCGCSAPGSSRCWVRRLGSFLLDLGFTVCWWSSASRPITLHHSHTSSHRWMTLCFFNAKTTTTNQTAFFFFFWFIMKYFAKVILLLRNLGPSCVKLLIKSQVDNLVNKALIAELTPYHAQNASRSREKKV